MESNAMAKCTIIGCHKNNSFSPSVVKRYHSGYWLWNVLFQIPANRTPRRIRERANGRNGEWNFVFSRRIGTTPRELDFGFPPGSYTHYHIARIRTHPPHSFHHPTLNTQYVQDTSHRTLQQRNTHMSFRLGIYPIYFM